MADKQPSLKETFRQCCEKTSNRILDIPNADKDEKRKIYLVIAALLLGLRRDSVHSIKSLVLLNAAFHNERIVKQLDFPSVPNAEDIATLDKQKLEEIANEAAAKSDQHVKTLQDRLLAVALSMMLGRDHDIRLTLQVPKSAPIDDSQSRETLAKRLVIVRGSDGIDRRYDPESYSEVLQDSAQGQAQAEVSKQVAKALDTDLVEVSSQPSTIGDFCDLYRSKIFSISGNHPIVPPLSILPMGSAPMHVHCHHSLQPIDASQFSDDQLRALSRIPPEFVTLGENAARTSAFMALWQSKDWSGHVI